MDVYFTQLQSWLSSLNLSVIPTEVDILTQGRAIRIIDIQNPAVQNKDTCRDSDISIFSDEWENRSSQVKNFLQATLGIFDRKIYGRLCTIRKMTKEKASAFIEEYHIQGQNKLGVVFFGIYIEDELLGVMSLGRHHRKIDNTIVLDRLCFKTGVHIPGGASKLFKRCTHWAYEKGYDGIISWSDNRWSAGGVYQALQFVPSKDLPSDYSYVDTTQDRPVRFSKQSQKKKAVNCPPHLTEYQWALERGLARVYDKGKKRWYYELRKPESESVREKLSRKCAEQHASGVFRHNHIRGYFVSKKNQSRIYFSSSYELRCLYLLEQDPTATSFRRCESFKADDRWRNPDLYIDFGGKVEIWEIKPTRYTVEPEVIRQIEDTRAYCLEHGYGFRVWSEEDSGLDSERLIINWARRYLAERDNDPRFIEEIKERDRKKAKKHYDRVISQDKVTTYCDFCKEKHTTLRITHNKNVKKNGRFVCIKENGSIIGKRAKIHLRKENPYAAEGKKKCNSCEHVKPLEEFWSDKTKKDGRSGRCGQCAREAQNNRYKNKGS